MNERTVEEIVKQLERLGGPAWEYAVREAYIVGWLSVGYAALALAITVALGWIAWSQKREYRMLEQARKRRDDYYSSSLENEGTAITSMLAAVLGIFSAAWFFIASFTAARILLNPHYEAMKLLGRVIRGGG